MMVVVVYDIRTSSPAGRRRLREIARACSDFGLRVQNSVFECEVDAGRYRALRARIEAIVVPGEDRAAFYLLGNHYETRMEKLGSFLAPEERFVC